jgi:putative nucleotidyltransferase with HDIG domain
MSKALRLYIAGLVASAAVATVVTSLLAAPDPRIAITGAPNPGAGDIALGIGFWLLITLLASALPVELPGGTRLAVSIAPVIVAMNLGGPAVAAWVAIIGTTEAREIRGRIPWYGTLANHAGIALPVVAGAWVAELIGRGVGDNVARDFLATILGAGVLFVLNLALASTLTALRTGRSISIAILADLRVSVANFLALAPLGWLMARIYAVPGAGWWATLLFALPLYTTRVAHHRFVEMREMFTQTIQSLANAVDKRDPFTANHSQRVMLIASDIGRELKCTEPEMEALEWGGLLHDIGKIGVRDEILLKQDKLTKEERMKMNAHPELGAEIIAPVRRLAPELPIIRHHHEWYNGSGYPDRLIGDEIPKLARILHVADAFEAMTAQRPYRMTPLTTEQALGELRKFAGVQFDPTMVDAFVRTQWVDGVNDPGRTLPPRQIPLLAQAAAGRLAKATGSSEAGTASDLG